MLIDSDDVISRGRCKQKLTIEFLIVSELYLQLLLIIIYIKFANKVLLHYKQQIIVNMREVGFEPTNP